MKSEFAEDENFEEFWQIIEDYAKELGVSTQYIEEEFFVDGELIRINEELLRNPTGT